MIIELLILNFLEGIALQLAWPQMNMLMTFILIILVIVTIFFLAKIASNTINNTQELKQIRFILAELLKDANDNNKKP